jgi:uncharacterized membrane protein
MLTLYTALKSLHVIAAVVWVGGGIAASVLMMRLRAARDDVVTVRMAAHFEFLGSRVLTGAALLLIVTGFATMAEGGLEFELWIILGLVGWLASSINGGALLGPQSQKLAALAGEPAPDAQAVDAGLRRLMTFARIDSAILLLVIIDMVVKPGT